MVTVTFGIFSTLINVKEMWARWGGTCYKWHCYPCYVKKMWVYYWGPDVNCRPNVPESETNHSVSRFSLPAPSTKWTPQVPLVFYDAGNLSIRICIAMHLEFTLPGRHHLSYDTFYLLRTHWSFEACGVISFAGKILCKWIWLSHQADSHTWNKSN